MLDLHARIAGEGGEAVHASVVRRLEELHDLVAARREAGMPAREFEASGRVLGALGVALNLVRRPAAGTGS